MINNRSIIIIQVVNHEKQNRTIILDIAVKLLLEVFQIPQIISSMMMEVQKRK